MAPELLAVGSQIGGMNDAGTGPLRRSGKGDDAGNSAVLHTRVRVAPATDRLVTRTHPVRLLAGGRNRRKA